MRTVSNFVSQEVPASLPSRGERVSLFTTTEKCPKCGHPLVAVMTCPPSYQCACPPRKG